jgi:snoRNA binding domain, fibrillarin
VADAVLIRGGDRLYHVSNARPPGEGIRLRPEDLSDESTMRIPPALADALRADSGVAAADSFLENALRRVGISAPLAPLEVVRTVRERLPVPEREAERRFLLELAHQSVERVLSSPEEVLISLAREEERVERAVRREENAAHQFTALANVSLHEYESEWSKFRDLFTEHHRSLEGQLDAKARLVVPNLTAVVGARVAARLVAQAGGVATLAMMSASRLQLLGARRRPIGGRGPRFGVLFRATRMPDVPLSRQGAYARSLAAIAAIAVRADWSTRRSIADPLVRRRDRRISQLQRGRA